MRFQLTIAWLKIGVDLQNYGLKVGLLFPVLLLLLRHPAESGAHGVPRILGASELKPNKVYVLFLLVQRAVHNICATGTC